MNAQGVVISDYSSYFPDPISIKENTRVFISHCDLEYPGWVGIIADGGAAGWAPQQIFITDNVNEVICTEDYTARELSVSPSDKINVMKSLNGWYWITNASGESGWVPGDCVVLI